VLEQRYASFGEEVGEGVRSARRVSRVEAGNRPEQRARIEVITPPALFGAEHQAERAGWEVDDVTRDVALGHAQGEGRLGKARLVQEVDTILRDRVDAERIEAASTKAGAAIGSLDQRLGILHVDVAA